MSSFYFNEWLQSWSKSKAINFIFMIVVCTYLSIAVIFMPLKVVMGSIVFFGLLREVLRVFLSGEKIKKLEYFGGISLLGLWIALLTVELIRKGTTEFPWYIFAIQYIIVGYWLINEIWKNRDFQEVNS